MIMEIISVDVFDFVILWQSMSFMIDGEFILSWCIDDVFYFVICFYLMVFDFDFFLFGSVNVVCEFVCIEDMFFIDLFFKL